MQLVVIIMISCKNKENWEDHNIAMLSAGIDKKIRFVLPCLC